MTRHEEMAVRCVNAAGAELLVAEYPVRASALSAARNITRGHIRAYRPQGTFEANAFPSQAGTAVWARYTGGLGLGPLPQTMTVRVPDYSRQSVQDGVPVATVEISARCPLCGGPRGEARPSRSVLAGMLRETDVWTNPCGHTDTYAALLAEAARLRELPDQSARRRMIRGVEGGRFCTAVDLIAPEIVSWPWMTARSAAELLDNAGEQAAAAEVRRFLRSSTTGSTSARSAALYLVHCDREALAARPVDGGDR